MNYPDGMTRSDYIHVGELEPDFEPEPRVLRAVIYLTYNNRGVTFPEEMIEEVQSPSEAARDIERVLSTGLEFLPDDIQVVDEEYMSEREADIR